MSPRLQLGAPDDQGNAVGIEPWGDITVVGSTGSSDFPVTADAVQSVLDTLDEAFLTRLSPDGTELLYSTFLDGNQSDQGFGLASDGLGSVVATGMVQATNFATTSESLRPSVAGFSETGDAFVTKLDFQPPPLFTRQGVVNAASFDGGPLAPYAVAGSTATNVRVEHRGLLSPALSLPVESASPAIFTQTSSGRGPGTILNQDYSLNTPENPAPRGSIVVLYATGEGQTAPGGIDGKLAEETLPQPLMPVSVLISGQDAKVFYVGAAPGLVADVMQVNARVPKNIEAGDAVPIALRAGDFESPPGVTVAVR